MNKTGFESLEILSGKEIEYILNQEMNSIISLIEFLNFNESHPENHTFCTTALNDKYVSTMNTETFAIEKQRKTDFYDNLIHRGINNMKLLFERLKVMKIKKLSNYEDKIKQLIDFLVVNKKGNVYKVKKLNQTKEFYIVTDGNGKFSHGETLKEAKEDLIYKISSNLDKSKYKNLTLQSKLTFEEGIEAYRVITGACSFGVKDFVTTNKVKKTSYTIEEIIKLTSNSYGGSTFKEFFK
jgi:hypothetical protein